MAGLGVGVGQSEAAALGGEVVACLLADVDREGLSGREVGEGDVEAGWNQYLVAVGDQRRGPLTPSGHADHRIGRVTTGNLERKGIGDVGWIGIGRRHRDAEQCEQHGGDCRPALHVLASPLGRRRMFRREGWPWGPPPDRSRARRLAALSGAVSIPRLPYFGLVMVPPVSGAGRLLDRALASGSSLTTGMALTMRSPDHIEAWRRSDRVLLASPLLELRGAWIQKSGK